MKKLVIAAVLSVLASDVMAADGGFISETASKAIAKGYGTTCSLEMKPVERAGYFPCIDIGPYRLVYTYTAIKGFVIQKGQPPFLVLAGPKESPSFVVDGPWTSDMPARVMMWWNDEVEGRAQKLQETRRTSSEKKAAEEYVNKLMGRSEAVSPPPAPAPVPQKQVSPVEPDPEQTEIGEDIKQILQN